MSPDERDPADARRRRPRRRRPAPTRSTARRFPVDPWRAGRDALRRRRPRHAPRRSSPSATATSACAATSRRAATPTRTAPSSTASTRPGRSSTPRRRTASPASARRSSTRPDAKVIRLYVDDEPLLLSVADLLEYERALDFRTGVLQPRRSCGARRPASGCGSRTTRMVSLDPAAPRGDDVRGDPARRRRHRSRSRRRSSTARTARTSTTSPAKAMGEGVDPRKAERIRAAGCSSPVLHHGDTETRPASSSATAAPRAA